MRPSRTHVQTTSDSPNWRRQHSTCNDKNDPSSLLPLRHLPLPLWTADISFNNKLTCNSNSAAYLAISQYQVRPMPFALHWVAYAAQNLVSRVHSTMYLHMCALYLCAYVWAVYACVRVCIWHASKFISAQDQLMRLSGIFRRRLQLRLQPGMLLLQLCLGLCVWVSICVCLLVSCFLFNYLSAAEAPSLVNACETTMLSTHIIRG